MSGNKERIKHVPGCPVCNGFNERGELCIWELRDNNGIIYKTYMCINYKEVTAKSYGEFNALRAGIKDFDSEKVKEILTEVITRSKFAICMCCYNVADEKTFERIIRCVKNDWRKFPRGEKDYPYIEL